MRHAVSVKTSVSYKAWLAPNFASILMPVRQKQDGFQTLPSVPVQELSDAALAALAWNWLDDLYTKAGKTNPFQQP